MRISFYIRRQPGADPFGAAVRGKMPRQVQTPKRLNLKLSRNPFLLGVLILAGDGQ